ncbi:MAG: CHAP domain-containing protein [Rhodoglobus sp.]
MRAIQASATQGTRKNPLSVLVTMAVVGGMFAVAGLPAYASQSTTATVAPETQTAQSLVISSSATVSAPVRDGYRATTPEQLAEMETDARRAANQAAYLASGARELGDDYPWYFELRDYEGGGLSPLNYYYRECVDFVAWRLNRDAGYYAAPFKWVWSNLTPLGGNASQWMYNWEQKGWPVSNVPVVGSVAYTGGNHIAYVKSVNADGTVTIEEYNYFPGRYSQRIIAASSVVAFLYPPT